MSRMLSIRSGVFVESRSKALEFPAMSESTELTLRLAVPEDSQALLGVVREAFSARAPVDPPAAALAEDEDTIRAALADELLFGRLVNGGKVTIDLDEDDKVKLVFEETETATA